MTQDPKRSFRVEMLVTLNLQISKLGKYKINNNKKKNTVQAEDLVSPLTRTSPGGQQCDLYTCRMGPDGKERFDLPSLDPQAGSTKPEDEEGQEKEKEEEEVRRSTTRSLPPELEPKRRTSHPGVI